MFPLCSDCKFSLWEVHQLFASLLCYSGGFVFGQISPECSGLFRPQIQRQFLVLVEQSQLFSLRRVDDCENPGNILSNIVTFFISSVHRCGIRYILVTFDEAPPATFCTRREANSCFNSSNCFISSALVFSFMVCAAIFEPACIVSICWVQDKLMPTHRKEALLAQLQDASIGS